MSHPGRSRRPARSGYDAATSSFGAGQAPVTAQVAEEHRLPNDVGRCHNGCRKKQKAFITDGGWGQGSLSLVPFHNKLLCPSQGCTLVRLVLRTPLGGHWVLTNRVDLRLSWQPHHRGRHCHKERCGRIFRLLYSPVKSDDSCRSLPLCSALWCLHRYSRSP